MPDELRETYKTIGGVPFLDNQYTVYGEVVEGLDVVDAIQQVKTNKQDRPTATVVTRRTRIIGFWMKMRLLSSNISLT